MLLDDPVCLAALESFQDGVWDAAMVWGLGV